MHLHSFQNQNQKTSIPEEITYVSTAQTQREEPYQILSLNKSNTSGVQVRTVTEPLLDFVPFGLFRREVALEFWIVVLQLNPTEFQITD